MKKKLLFILLMLVVVNLIACTEVYEELPGVVYQKEIKPEGTAREKDNQGNEYEYTYPERYILYVKYDLGNDEFLIKAYFVSKTIYEASNVGDEYYYNSIKDNLEEPYISRKEVE